MNWMSDVDMRSLMYWGAVFCIIVVAGVVGLDIGFFCNARTVCWRSPNPDSFLQPAELMTGILVAAAVFATWAWFLSKADRK